MNPSDPAIRWVDCVTTYGDFPMPVTVRDRKCAPRASIQRWAASEIGVDFQDVRVLARWGRIFTRQEVWDSGGDESWASDQGWGKYKTPNGWRWHSDDDVGDAQQSQVQLVTKDGFDTGLNWSKIAERVIPTEPPPDWTPSDYLHAWEFCKPTHPDATPLYVIEEW